jgi:hypothetical protein
MTKKLIWRLKEQPSTESLRELVKDKILTNDEAREILFSSQEETERDVKSLEAEIKFLRELVEKLSQNRSQIVEVIKEVRTPYYQYQWYQPYTTWCGSGTLYCTNTTSNAMVGTATSNSNCSFTSINTF